MPTGFGAGDGDHRAASWRADDGHIPSAARRETTRKQILRDGGRQPQPGAQIESACCARPVHDRALHHCDRDIVPRCGHPDYVHAAEAGAPQSDPPAVAAVVAQVRLPEPTDDWQHDAYRIADAMWRGIRAHPAAIPLVLTRRTLSATGFAAADALIAALGRADLPDRDRLAAFHAVLGFVVGGA